MTESITLVFHLLVLLCSIIMRSDTCYSVASLSYHQYCYSIQHFITHHIHLIMTCQSCFHSNHKSSATIPTYLSQVEVSSLSMSYSTHLSHGFNAVISILYFEFINMTANVILPQNSIPYCLFISHSSLNLIPMFLTYIQ